MTTTSNKVNGRRKAAILMISLGLENASSIFAHLRQEEIEDIIVEIANMKVVEPKDKKEIVNEFYAMCIGQEYLLEGGITYAKELLRQSLGESKATAIIAKLTKTIESKPFEALRKMTKSQILYLLQDEHPQMIALVLSYLIPAQAAEILAAYEVEKEAELTRRIARMGQVAPEVIGRIEKVMDAKIAKVMKEEQKAAGGVDTVIDIISSGDSENRIMEHLEQRDPELAKHIRKHIFMFEDFEKLNVHDRHKVINKIEFNELVTILKGCDEKFANLMMQSIPKRILERIKEELKYTNSTEKEIEQAKQELVKVVRKLEADGQIHIKEEGETLNV